MSEENKMLEENKEVLTNIDHEMGESDPTLVFSPLSKDSIDEMISGLSIVIEGNYRFIQSAAYDEVNAKDRRILASVQCDLLELIEEYKAFN